MHIYTEGLKTRSKRSRPSELSEEEVMYHIKKELKESSHGWTTKQVEGVNRKGKRYKIIILM